MADGNSTGPGITPPVSPVPTVIQAGSFATVLDDDQINLHLMNNHVIQRFVENFAEAVAPPQRIIDSIAQGVRDDIDFIQSTSPEQAEITANAQNTARGERNDTEQVRRINNARDQIAQAEAAMEEGIHAELQRVNDAFYEIATKLLNANNPTAAGIRAQISQIDAEVAGLEAELATLDDITRQHSANPTAFRSGDTAPIEPLIQDLDATGISPPSNYIDGGPGNLNYGTWQEYYQEQVFSGRMHRGLRAVEVKSEEIHRRIQDISNQYPEAYKDYQKLLGGFSLAERNIDWWAIATTVAWVIAEEAAWIAAGVVLAPVTGGIATAVIVSARMARRAGAVGRLVAAGIGAGVNVARWFARLEARIQDKAFDAFKRAWDRVRGRQPARRGDPGGEVEGRGETPRDAGCPVCR